MPTFLSKLFKSSPAPKDGLAQTEREAIVDLLLYCMYADSNIAQAEGDFVADSLAKLDWASGTSIDYYESQATSLVRKAKEDPEALADFLKSIRTRLASSSARARALDLARKLFLSDGTKSDRETTLEGTLRKLLG